VGGSGNLEHVQKRADNLIAAGQNRHGDALPSESCFGSPIERLLDMTLGNQLSHETLSDSLLVGQVFGRSTVGKRSDCGFRQTGFESDCRVSVELVIGLPYRPDCENHHLTDSVTERRVPCFCSLEIKKAGSHLGCEQDRVERSDQLSVRSPALEVSGVCPRDHRGIDAIVKFPLRSQQPDETGNRDRYKSRQRPLVGGVFQLRTRDNRRRGRRSCLQ
jgi:hypothetical protein